MERLAVETGAPQEQTEESRLADYNVSPDEFREMTARAADRTVKKRRAKTPQEG